MNHRDPFRSIHRALCHARHVLPEKLHWWPMGLEEKDFDVYCFGQTWPSTALGHGGVGCREMSEADTVVLVASTGHAAVYFGNRLAHAVEKPNSKFREDLARGRMAGVAENPEYERK